MGLALKEGYELGTGGREKGEEGHADKGNRAEFRGLLHSSTYVGGYNGWG